MNYAEALGYWYLRLNGFFVLRNIVVHRAEGLVEHSADCDLLAMRFPHVRECIGDGECKWDVATFERWDLDLTRRRVALIVEVKGGRTDVTTREVSRAFGHSRVLTAIRRLGVWQESRTTGVAEALRHSDRYVDARSGFTVAKLLITNQTPPPGDTAPSLHLDLTHVNSFIHSRMRDHVDDKAPDRVFFPSELMQYIIWQAEHEE